MTNNTPTADSTPCRSATNLPSPSSRTHHLRRVGGDGGGPHQHLVSPLLRTALFARRTTGERRSPADKRLFVIEALELALKIAEADEEILEQVFEEQEEKEGIQTN